MSPTEAERVLALARACNDRLSTTERRRPDGVEHLTSPHAGEGNSETQAWVLLADGAADAAVPGAAGPATEHALAEVLAATHGAAPALAAEPQPAPPAEPSSEALHEARTLRFNVKMLAATLARARLAGIAEATALPDEPCRVGLGSRICCQADMEQAWLRHWCHALGTAPRYHRKLWEDCFVPQALWEAGMLKAGRRGLGFAVGREDLPAFLVGRGIEVLATDLDAADDRAGAWRDSGQHANQALSLYRPRLAQPAECDRLLAFRPVDMTAIPEDLLQGRFDFIWSVCALEHLGSLEAGETFIRMAMRCLRRGGIAVHTTEYNLDQEGPTLATGSTVLFQRRHLDRLAQALAADGHAMLPMQDPPGGQHLFDQLVDVPPYPHQGGPPDAPHLRLTLGGYTTTSVGVIIQAGAA
ncbi:methyltransferase domain-containing protein [Dankookia sp. P2]|uniref:methyltransferase domain-containing protein n=1 Tax=Dankookia sp. P2 TaxID=3423955 RepID=UPI003D678FA2